MWCVTGLQIEMKLLQESQAKTAELATLGQALDKKGIPSRVTAASNVSH